MSGLAVILHRGGTPPPGGQGIAAMLDALDHRGADGRHAVARGPVVLGAQNHWTTAEDVGCTQPLADDHNGLDVVFDGRIDNRRDLADDLGIDRCDLPGLSDAALFLRAFRTWRDGCFSRIVGPFAAVVWDRRNQRLTAARDALGNRNLVYHENGDLALVASEEVALLAHPALDTQLDETSMARFFAVRAPAEGATYFTGVHSLPPGNSVFFDQHSNRVRQHSRVADLPTLRYRNDQQYIDEFEALLETAVSCRLRGRATPFVQMSGGLDSTSIVAIAHRRAASPTPTVSWTFNETPAADERPYLDTMIEHFDLDATRIGGDGHWPLRYRDQHTPNPNAPWDSLYRSLIRETYRTVGERGGGVLLDGMFGDHLYARSHGWLYDLLGRRRFGTAWTELATRMTDRGHSMRSKIGDLARAVTNSDLGAIRRRRHPDWMNPEARRIVGESDRHSRSADRGRRSARRDLLLNPLIAVGRSLERSNAIRCGIDLRSPYRDRRLIEFCLRLPADLLQRRGWNKWILRKAMEGQLPEKVRLRWQTTSFIDLCTRGLADREAHYVGPALADPHARWRGLVDPVWLHGNVPSVFARDSVDNLAAWNCICADLWGKTHNVPSTLGINRAA